MTKHTGERERHEPLPLQRSTLQPIKPYNQRLFLPANGSKPFKVLFEPAIRGQD